MAASVTFMETIGRMALWLQLPGGSGLLGLAPLLFTSEGRVSIKQVRYAEDSGSLDPACSCFVCWRYSRAYLRHLYASNELLAQVLNTVHNLHFYLETMRRVRESMLGRAQGCT